VERYRPGTHSLTHSIGLAHTVSLEWQVSLSAFSFLFCEIVHYAQGRSAQVNINDLERRFVAGVVVRHVDDSADTRAHTIRLSDIGYSVGSRMLDLLVYRDKSTRRELRLVGMLSFVQTSVWKALFGKPADSLERSIEHEDECTRAPLSRERPRYRECVLTGRSVASI